MSKSAYQQVAKVIVDKARDLSEAERKALKGLLYGFNNQPQLPFPSYSVTVDYSASVKQLIKSGKYDWFNDDITSGHFPSNEKGKSQLVIYLLNFNSDISSENALKEMGKLGLRPATLKELLALGAKHPKLQRNEPIVALGSTWRVSDGDVDVPYLVGDESRRSLNLVWFVGDWRSDWRFAAVRK